MFLSKISGRAFKGGDFDVELTKLTVLHGDNFVGKTRIADAVRLLLIGHLPELGKLPRSTYELASGPCMVVSGVLSDGVVDYALSRKFWLEGDTVKSEASLPDFVKGSTLLTVMLNAEAYFSLSDRDRVDYVFANIGLSITKEAILAKVAERTLEHDGKVRVELLDVVTQDDEGGNPIVTTPQLLAERLIEVCTSIWKREKDHAKRMEQTIQGLTGLRAQDAQFRPVREAMDERALVERKLTDLAESKGRLLANFTAMRSAQERRKAIARDLVPAEKDRLELIDLEAKLGLLLAELEKLPVALADAATLATEVANATNDHNRVKDAWTDAVRRHALHVKTLDDLAAWICCPTCGTSGEGWKATRRAELVALRDAESETIVDLEAKRIAAAGAMGTACAKRDMAKQEAAKTERLKLDAGKVREAIVTIKTRLARADALKEELDRLPPFDAELEATVDGLQATENLRKAEKRTLDEEIDAANAREAEKTRLASAEKERDEAAADQATAKSIGEILREIQSELVEEAFAPLLATANAIFGPVLKTPLAYHAGEIGTRRDGVWVGHKTFSGTEKALAYAAIQCALAAKSRVRIMLLDELGRLTFENAELAAAAVAKAIDAGHLDQFLGIDPERPGLYTHLCGPLVESPFAVVKIG